MPLVPGLLNRKARRVPLAGPNALIAAATIGAKQLTSVQTTSGQWADQAWEYYDCIGELRYAANWIGNALSRATLHIARAPEGNGKPERVDIAETDDQGNPVPQDPEVTKAIDALASLAGGSAGQAELLKTWGVHLTVVGDSYLIGYDDPTDNVQRWIVRTQKEVQASGNRISVKINGLDVMLPEAGTALLRIWRPHPRRSWEADSPTRGVLPVLHELERLTQMILAQANSRLAGAGLLLLPSEFDFPNPAGWTPPPVAEGATPPALPPKAQTFVDRLAHAMVTPVTDRSDPSAVVPIVVTAPGDQIANARLIQFWTPLDGQAIELRKEAIRRFATGMDMPIEVLLGVGNMNHWSAWQVDESAVRLQIEPLLGLICDALTVGFLRPLLGAESDLMIWFDTAELVLRPNRGPDSVLMYDREQMSGKALLEEHGFGEDTAPDDEELRQRRLVKLAEGGGPLAEAAARELGLFKLPPPVAAPAVPPVAPPGAEPAPAAPPAAPGIPVQPTGNETPAQAPAAGVPTSAVAAVLAAHALDYAGKRWLKGQPRGAYQRGLPPSRIHEHIPVPPEKAADLLAGAFDAFDACDQGDLLVTVGGYVERLITAGTRHDPALLTAALAGASP